MKSKNLQLIPNAHWMFRYNSGGELRKKRLGRFARSLTTKDPHHVVFKMNKSVLRSGLRSPRHFALLKRLIEKYSKRFFIKIEQCSIQNDHIHLLIRARKRSCFQSFFKVLAGQFSQSVTGTQNKAYENKIRLWKYRPFSRVVKGYKAYVRVQNYVQLNELEVIRKRVYRKTRLAGLTEQEIAELWI